MRLLRVLRLGLFVAVALSLLGLAHNYVAGRLVRDLAFAGPIRPALEGVVWILGASMLGQPIGERWLPRAVARPLGWVASLWMGFAFFLIVLLGATDLILWLLGPLLDDRFGTIEIARGRAGLVVSLSGLAAAVGMRNALPVPAVRRVELALPRWPSVLDGFRIAQISDIHIGPILDRAFASRLVARVNGLDADLVAVTGDLVDGSVRRLAAEVAPFGELRGRHGAYFVTGNHDHYSGAGDWCAHIESLGLRVLRNERTVIEHDGVAFDLAGVDDHHGGFLDDDKEDLSRALAGRDPERPVILLAHDPTTFRAAAQQGVDLQISGHTHGGQMFPFMFLVRLAIPFVAGLYRRGDTTLYVSRGTGFWGPPMRLAAPAEITEIVVRSRG